MQRCWLVAIASFRCFGTSRFFRSTNINWDNSDELLVLRANTSRFKSTEQSRKVKIDAIKIEALLQEGDELLT